MMRSISAALIFLGLASASTTAAAANQRTYKVYHRLGSGDFAERGSVVLAVGSAVESEDNGTQAASSPAGGADQLTATAKNAEDCIVPAAVDDMILSGSMYTVKVVDEATGQSATASVPGCDVRRANFREEIGLTLSQTGSLVSVTYNPLVSPLAPPCQSFEPLASDHGSEVPEFKTTVTYETAKPAMTVPLVLPKVKPPPGMKAYPIPRKKASENGGEAGTGGGGTAGGGGSAFEDEEAKGQNQPFLMKYWYIILPIVIMQFVGGGSEQPEETAQGGGEGGGGPPPAGAAAVATSGSASPPKQRRGKRG